MCLCTWLPSCKQDLGLSLRGELGHPESLRSSSGADVLIGHLLAGWPRRRRSVVPTIMPHEKFLTQSRKARSEPVRKWQGPRIACVVKLARNWGATCAPHGSWQCRLSRATRPRAWTEPKSGGPFRRIPKCTNFLISGSAGAERLSVSLPEARANLCPGRSRRELDCHGRSRKPLQHQPVEGLGVRV